MSLQTDAIPLAYNRVPKVTADFWLIKLMAVTMGETAADYLAVNLGLGLTATSLIMTAILIGALVFANFVNLTTMPAELIAFTERFASTPMLVIVAICAIYVLLGCVLESMSMILLTVPMFYPVVQHLGFDLIWFGIIVVVVTEISLITPPVGLNVFVLRSVLPDVATGEVFRGVLPFVASDVVRLAILIAFPGITLYLTRFVA